MPCNVRHPLPVRRFSASFSRHFGSVTESLNLLLAEEVSEKAYSNIHPPFSQRHEMMATVSTPWHPETGSGDARVSSNKARFASRPRHQYHLVFPCGVPSDTDGVSANTLVASQYQHEMFRFSCTSVACLNHDFMSSSMMSSQ